MLTHSLVRDSQGRRCGSHDNEAQYFERTIGWRMQKRMNAQHNGIIQVQNGSRTPAE